MFLSLKLSACARALIEIFALAMSHTRNFDSMSINVLVCVGISLRQCYNKTHTRREREKDAEPATPQSPLFACVQHHSENIFSNSLKMPNESWCQSDIKSIECLSSIDPNFIFLLLEKIVVQQQQCVYPQNVSLSLPTPQHKNHLVSPFVSFCLCQQICVCVYMRVCF